MSNRRQMLERQVSRLTGTTIAPVSTAQSGRDNSLIGIGEAAVWPRPGTGENEFILDVDSLDAENVRLG